MLLSVLVVVVEATLKILLVVLCGVYLGRAGIFSTSVVSGLSLSLKQVVLPALLFSVIADAATLANILRWWPLFAFGFVSVLFGLCVGRLVQFCFGVDRQVARFLMVLLTFGNTTSIPLALFDSIVDSDPSALSIDPIDFERKATLGRAYVLMYTLFMNILRWSIAYRLLAPRTVEPAHSIEQAVEERGEATLETGIDQVENAVDGIDHTLLEQDSPEPPLASGGQKIFQRFSTVRCRITSAYKSSMVEKGAISLWLFGKSFPPPVWFALLAMCVGLVPFLRGLFFADKKEEQEQGIYAPYLGFVADVLTKLGSAYVPLILMILGSKLAKGPKHAGKLTLGMLILVIFLRLIVTPAILALGVAPLFGYALSSVDNVMVFVMQLEVTMPPAISLIVIALIHQNMLDEMVTSLFYSYLMGIITVVSWVLVYLYINSQFKIH